MDVSVRIKPDANATVGLVPMTFNATTDHQTSTRLGQSVSRSWQTACPFCRNQNPDLRAPLNNPAHLL